jgi:hypothetical protein
VGGARWVQSELLERERSNRLKAYAVWFNMVAGDQRSRWPKGLLHDPRVSEFWDQAKVLGAWYARQPQHPYPGEVTWDAWVLYGPQAKWTERATGALGWGYTILRTRDQLKRDLAAALRR